MNKLKNKINNLVAFSLIYLAQNKIHKHDDIVIKYLNEHNQEWGNMIASIRTASEDYLIELWNKKHEDINDEAFNKISNRTSFEAFIPIGE